MRHVLEENRDRGPDNPDFNRLRDFYEEKKKEGLISKSEYTLPPIDTVGRIRCRWSGTDLED